VSLLRSGDGKVHYGEDSTLPLRNTLTVLFRAIAKRVGTAGGAQRRRPSILDKAPTESDFGEGERTR